MGDRFEVGSLEEAKKIILTGPTEDRWAKETPYMVELCQDYLAPISGHCVLDFGCGVGRVARPLIEATGCYVAGWDTAMGMRKLAREYVKSPRFVMPTALPVPCDSGYAIWVLQHAKDLSWAVAQIAACIRRGGRFLLVGERARMLPVPGSPIHWYDDHKSVLLAMQHHFALLEQLPLDRDFVPAGDGFAALFERTR